MGNMDIYNQVRVVPKEAQKTIKGGRLSGFTDINAMWRIQKLTETFGPCGIGWYYTIEREWLENGANGEVAAFMDILLYYKQDGEWSKGIPGTGGSSFVAKERNGLYISDECYKMALTDAISVAAKAIGMGADVYWEKGRTKYDIPPQEEPKNQKEPTNPKEPEYFRCESCGKILKPYNDANGKSVPIRKHAEGSKAKFGHIYCLDCIQKFSEMANMSDAIMSQHEDAGDRV